MIQINYVSKNQLHSTANLNFGLMGKEAKHCWVFSTNFSFLFSWFFFLIMFCFLLNWRKKSNYFKIAVWRACLFICPTSKKSSSRISHIKKVQQQNLPHWKSPAAISTYTWVLVHMSAYTRECLYTFTCTWKF